MGNLVFFSPGSSPQMRKINSYQGEPDLLKLPGKTCLLIQVNQKIGLTAMKYRSKIFSPEKMDPHQQHLYILESELHP